MKRSEEGATLVEFAISASILFMVLFGMIEFSMGLYAYNFLAYATKDAARYAMVRGSNCTVLNNCGAKNTEVQAFINNEGYPGISNSITTTTNFTCEAIPDPSLQNANCNAPGDLVTVTATYPFTLNVPFMKPITMQFSSSSAMIISN
ncbi:TadE/TadG family type IV pilus assembly protein [Occallatibacter savannae]|uniref:TadE/TadG family type IV pilus assembly protein n=1 Tax=Occallatibacter savannae TaxID=1002691 RepID=UPI000D6997AD|nr:TadE/TadG family type IV pilus assembly protein [Occallatibacter savannae]